MRDDFFARKIKCCDGLKKYARPVAVKPVGLRLFPTSIRRNHCWIQPMAGTGKKITHIGNKQIRWRVSNLFDSLNLQKRTTFMSRTFVVTLLGAAAPISVRIGTGAFAAPIHRHRRGQLQAMFKSRGYSNMSS
jgi:hypothetical protein